MGCSQSAVQPASEAAPIHRRVEKNSKSRTTVSNVQSPNANETNNIQTKDSPPTAGAKPVAFEIAFEQPATYNSLVNRHHTSKFKKLEPLSNALTFTAEQLEEKIRQAEENRQRELDKKKEPGRRSQKLRSEIQKAREADKASHIERELENKLHAAEDVRLQKQVELQEKKRIREERARKAREKAKRMKQEGGEELDYEIDKDDAFNVDDDSWPDGDSNKHVDDTSDYHTGNDSRYNSGYGDRVYSGDDAKDKMAGSDKHHSDDMKTVDDDGDFYGA